MVPLSVGLSKSGACTKLNAPVDDIANLDLSAPDGIDQVTVSLAVNVWIAVVFSATDFVEVSPVEGPGPVITGDTKSTTDAWVTFNVTVEVVEFPSASFAVIIYEKEFVRFDEKL